MTKQLLIFFFYTLIVSLITHRFFVVRAERYKLKKTNTSAERWASQTKPILGGVTFYGIFVFSILNYGIFFGGSNLLTGKVFGMLIVITMSFMMGFADDMLNTPPGFKFIFQLLASIILIWSGISIHIFENEWYNYLLTTFWVIGIMNSVNMLDNMDAITTSVSSTILIGAIAILYISQPYAGVLLWVTVGALASLSSFLYYNWNPSKMYMGDNGSQFLGALLAIIGIEVFWNSPVPDTHPTIYPFLFIFMAFIIPLSDTTTVTINRLMRGQSPFVGGRDHTTHHLSYLGLSERAIATVLLSTNLLFVTIAVLYVLKPQAMPSPFIFAGLAIAVFVTLYSITKISSPKK